MCNIRHFPNNIEFLFRSLPLYTLFFLLCTGEEQVLNKVDLTGGRGELDLTYEYVQLSTHQLHEFTDGSDKYASPLDDILYHMPMEECTNEFLQFELMAAGTSSNPATSGQAGGLRGSKLGGTGVVGRGSSVAATAPAASIARISASASVTSPTYAVTAAAAAIANPAAGSLGEKKKKKDLGSIASTQSVANSFKNKLQSSRNRRQSMNSMTLNIIESTLIVRETVGVLVVSSIRCRHLQSSGYYSGISAHVVFTVGEVAFTTKSQSNQNDPFFDEVFHFIIRGELSEQRLDCKVGYIIWVFSLLVSQFFNRLFCFSWRFSCSSPLVIKDWMSAVGQLTLYHHRDQCTHALSFSFLIWINRIFEQYSFDYYGHCEGVKIHGVK